MAASQDLFTIIFPCILRGIKLTGIDSAEAALVDRNYIWNKRAADWKPKNLKEITREISLDDLPEVLD
jgi:acrylyl-CoA reductase (NADPH)